MSEVPRLVSPKPDFVDVTSLVSSIQRQHGSPDCFRKTEGDCDQWECAWRKYCLKKPALLGWTE
jgi:hypothetical protein